MASPDGTVLQRSGLNDFLFVEIGMEPNGMTLSVVSVFARQGSDPWREAGDSQIYRRQRRPTAWRGRSPACRRAGGAWLTRC